MPQNASRAVRPKIGFDDAANFAQERGSTRVITHAGQGCAIVRRLRFREASMKGAHGPS